MCHLMVDPKCAEDPDAVERLSTWFQEHHVSSTGFVVRVGFDDVEVRGTPQQMATDVINACMRSLNPSRRE